jgi:hypothetical protein
MSRGAVGAARANLQNVIVAAGRAIQNSVNCITLRV